MTDKQKEFVMLWMLLTAAAATNTYYSPSQHNVTVDSIFKAITGDVKTELGNSWNWTNLTEPNARAVIQNAIDTQQTNGGYYAVAQSFYELIVSQNAPWQGGTVHPSVHELVTVLGITA